MTRSPFKWILLLTAVFLLCTPALSRAGSREKIRTPRTLDAIFDHLLAVVEGGRDTAFDPDRIGPLLEFVLSRKKTGALYHAGQLGDATSAYYDFRLRTSLADFMKLAYNPALPSYLTVPSTVRLSYWHRTGGTDRSLPRLWTHLDRRQAPVRVDGVETVVNTPDLFSGAYYRYDLDRTIILFRWEGKNVMLSLSKQRGRSDVGKKGAVLGTDDQWDYIYTDQEGLSRTGLGWVDSYMYDSFSVIAYIETQSDAPEVRCGIFKWIDAGWAGINVVQPRHIHRGLIRFARAFKTIVEAPALSDIPALEKTFRRIEGLSENALREKASRYYGRLRDRCDSGGRICKQWFDRAFGADGHLARMNRRQMEAIVCIEILKSMLGKEHQIDVGRLQSPEVGPAAGRQDARLGSESLHRRRIDFSSAGG